MMNLPSEITICEVGLRDGLQNEKTIVSTEDKLSLLRDLVDAGFPVIEVGSFMHPKKVPRWQIRMTCSRLWSMNSPAWSSAL